MNFKILFLSAALSLPAAASSLVVPGSCTATDCPGAQAVASVPIPVEIQQIFDASLFSGVTGPISVTGVALRPGANNTATTGTVNLNILGETTSQDANAGCASLPASTGCTYSNFVSTSGATQLFTGAQTFMTNNSGTPRNFDYSVQFATPFTYDPTTGLNLLLDLTIPVHGVSGTDGNLSFEAIGSGNRQSGTGAVETVLGGVNGLVVELNYSTVAAVSTPEPGTFALMGGSLIGIGMLLRKRKRA